MNFNYKFEVTDLGNAQVSFQCAEGDSAETAEKKVWLALRESVGGAAGSKQVRQRYKVRAVEVEQTEQERLLTMGGTIPLKDARYLSLSSNGSGYWCCGIFKADGERESLSQGHVFAHQAARYALTAYAGLLQ